MRRRGVISSPRSFVGWTLIVCKNCNPAYPETGAFRGISVSLVKFLVAGFALCGIATGTITVAEEKPAIQWMLTGVPPKFITDGPLKGTGYGEKQVAYLTQRLPQFQHRLELVTPARLWHEMQSSKGICSIDIAKVPD